METNRERKERDRRREEGKEEEMRGERIKDEDKERKEMVRTETSSIHWLTPAMSAMISVGPGLNQVPRTASGPPLWVTGTHALKLSFSAFPGILARTCEASGTQMAL